MVLSDVTIRKRLEAGDLKISPLDPKSIQPASVDLRLGNSFRVFDYSRQTFIDPTNHSATYMREVPIADGSTFVLHPGQFALGTTIETITLPVDLVGRLDGKSSLGRIGVVVHATAGHVNPGFSGQLTLELTNVGKLPVALYHRMAVCQIHFVQLTEPASMAYGDDRLGSKYQNQTGATEGLNSFISTEEKPHD